MKKKNNSKISKLDESTSLTNKQTNKQERRRVRGAPPEYLQFCEGPSAKLAPTVRARKRRGDGGRSPGDGAGRRAERPRPWWRAPRGATGGSRRRRGRGSLARAWVGVGGGLEARMQAPLTARPKEPRRAIAPAAWDPTAAVVWPRRVGPYPGMETVNWTVDHFSHTDPPNLCRSILPPSAIASP